MKIQKKIVNNMNYTKWMAIRKKSEKMINKHINDEDDIKFRYWLSLNILATKKCMEIDIR